MEIEKSEQEKENMVNGYGSGICKHCGQPFKKNHNLQIYCSEKCREEEYFKRKESENAQKRKKKTPHTCLWCHTSFLGSAHQNFCSGEQCCQNYFNMKQSIYKNFQFLDYKSELAKLEEQGKNYVMRDLESDINADNDSE